MQDCLVFVKSIIPRLESSTMPQAGAYATVSSGRRGDHAPGHLLSGMSARRGVQQRSAQQLFELCADSGFLM